MTANGIAIVSRSADCLPVCWLLQRYRALAQRLFNLCQHLDLAFLFRCVALLAFSRTPRPWAIGTRVHPAHLTGSCTFCLATLSLLLACSSLPVRCMQLGSLHFYCDALALHCCCRCARRGDRRCSASQPAGNFLLLPLSLASQCLFAPHCCMCSLLPLSALCCCAPLLLRCLRCCAVCV